MKIYLNLLKIYLEYTEVFTLFNVRRSIFGWGMVHGNLLISTGIYLKFTNGYILFNCEEKQPFWEMGLENELISLILVDMFLGIYIILLWGGVELVEGQALLGMEKGKK